MEKQAYLEYVKKTSPKTKQLPTLIIAFCVGGAICFLGQCVADLVKLAGVTDKTMIGSYTSMIMIFLASFFTGLGWYDMLGSYAGAGSIVPITGFANSIVSPAMEYNREGIVLGLMSKLFTIAGPIIVSGITVSVVVGLIYWVVGL